MSKYINPYTDFGFKKLFGEVANKDLLIDFLNQILPPHHQILDLEFRNVEGLPDVSTERKAIFDIFCETSSGERIIVEMQKAKINFFKERSLFYSTYPIRDQSKRGDWDFQLMPVYLVAILDFEYDEAEERRKFLREVALKDQDGDLFYDKLHFKFIQMPLFTKEAHELETHFDKWIYFLKKLPSFDEIPQILREPIFKKAFDTAEVANLSAALAGEYERSRLSYFELNAVKKTAEKDGFDRGFDRGQEAGFEKGIEKGIEKGAKEKALEIAQSLKKNGLDTAVIAAATGLSATEIEQL